MTLPADIVSPAFRVGAKGRVVLPVAVVIETVESIRNRVWDAAPRAGGHDVTAEVRAMRDEDNRLSDEAFVRRVAEAGSDRESSAAAVPVVPVSAMFVAAAVLLAASACGGEARLPSGADGPPGPDAPPGPVASASRSTLPSASSPDEPLAETDLGVLPVPADLALLQRRSMGLPDVLADAVRAPGEPEQIRYLRPGTEFGIDVSEIADLGQGIATTAQAFDALTAELEQPVTCARPPSWCLQGVSDGALTVLWGHDRSPLVYAAVAPDEGTLQALLQAWRQ